MNLTSLELSHKRQQYPLLLQGAVPLGRQTSPFFQFGTPALAPGGRRLVFQQPATSSKFVKVNGDATSCDYLVNRGENTLDVLHNPS